MHLKSARTRWHYLALWSAAFQLLSLILDRFLLWTGMQTCSASHGQVRYLQPRETTERLRSSTTSRLNAPPKRHVSVVRAWVVAITDSLWKCGKLYWLQLERFCSLRSLCLQLFWLCSFRIDHTREKTTTLSNQISMLNMHNQSCWLIILF